MSGEPARRTPTGRALRLVGPNDTAGLDASLVLSPERQSVTLGRHWVVRIASDTGVIGIANQVIELLTSELLANAVLHGAAGRAINLHFHGDDDVVRVAVGDSVQERPVVLHPELIAPSGRGMAIVEAMSNRWGVDVQADGGKVVWFEIDLDDY